MASSARIDELRKKFDENPRRYFAPLANEYRKAGDPEQAIFICQEYLPQQPGHMSGHIVYGQALFELQRYDDARTVFETALSLDPENLIALRHLGDIARLAGDTATARTWYQRVLEADPRNEEIAQIMLELLDAGAAPTPAAAAPAVDHNAPTPLSTPAVASMAADLETELSTPEPAMPEAATEPPSFAVEKTADLEMELPRSPEPEPEQEKGDLLDLDSFDLGGVPLSELRSSKPVESESESEPAPEFEAPAPAEMTMPSIEEPQEENRTATNFDLPFEADPFAIAAAPPEPPIESATDIALGLETFEAGTLSYTPPATEAIETDAFFDLSGAEPAPAAEAVAPSEPEMEIPAAPEPQPEPEAEERADAAPPFVTETMATLYLQQGHLESALEIYQQLVAQRPDDAELQERLRAVEARVHGVVEEPPSAVAEPASYGGPTIREFLSGLLARRTPVTVQEIPAVEPEAQSESRLEPEWEPEAEPEPEPEAVAERRPTPSSVETVGGSLGVLFSGADATASDAAAANTLAEAFQPEGPETEPLHGVPAHRASSELSLDHVFKNGGPQRRKEDGEDFSFDQFFAEDAVEQAPAPNAPAAPAEGGDDIAQFNAWLNGLKKT